MNYFINYDPNTGLSISTSRNQGYFNFELGGLVDDILNEREGCCSLEGALELLVDASYWQGSDATLEVLEELHNFITAYHNELGLSYE